MAKRGPPPLPTIIKKQRGTLKSTRVNKHEPKAEPEKKIPGVPEALANDDDAARCWKTLAPKLLKMKVLSKVDGLALEGLCRSYARAVQADREIAKRGLLVKTAWDTLVQNPAVSISRSSWAEVRKFAQEFGLTPSSRSRISELPDDEDAPQSSAEQFLFGAGGKIAGSIGRA